MRGPPRRGSDKRTEERAVSEAATEEATKDRKTVVVVVRYEDECEDEILGIHEATNKRYEGVTDVRAGFGRAAHEPYPQDPADEWEKHLLAIGKQAYEAWSGGGGERVRSLGGPARKSKNDVVRRGSGDRVVRNKEARPPGAEGAGPLAALGERDGLLPGSAGGPARLLGLALVGGTADGLGDVLETRLAGGVWVGVAGVTRATRTTRAGIGAARATRADMTAVSETGRPASAASAASARAGAARTGTTRGEGSGSGDVAASSGSRELDRDGGGVSWIGIVVAGDVPLAVRQIAVVVVDLVSALVVDQANAIRHGNSDLGWTW